MRTIQKLATGMVALALAGTGLLVAAPAQAATAHHPLGTRSLADVLTSDGNTFDHNWNDYDITTQAVLAVLAAKPHSAVKVLTDGTTPVTAFIPTDLAFRRLVHSLTGKWVNSEKQVFKDVAGLGIDTVETVLLYHVVPGATITAKQAIVSDGAKLTTAQGGTVQVHLLRIHGFLFAVSLVDKDKDARDPVIVRFDINKGNRQIAHGINQVLRPVDL